MSKLDKQAAKKFYKKHGNAPRRKFLYLAFKEKFTKYLTNIYSLNNFKGGTLQKSPIQQIIEGVVSLSAGVITVVLTLLMMVSGPIVSAILCIIEAYKNHKYLQKYIEEEVDQ